MKKILCMGSITMDMLMKIPCFPSPGETMQTDNFTQNPGGKGSNQAVTIAKLGGRVKYFTKLGGDSYSAQLMETLQSYGIDVSATLTDPNLSAGIALVLVESSGQNICTFFPGACRELSPQEVILNSTVFDGCDILLITMELQTETVFSAIREAKRRGMTVVLDPAPVPAQKIPSEIARMVDFIKPNETEAQYLTGVPVDSVMHANQALDVLLSQGFHCPLVTLGDKGCLTLLNGKHHYIEPIRVSTVDTTAAGDVFLGSFTLALAQGKSLTDCINFAQSAAALSTTRFGAQSSIPALGEVENFMQENMQ